MPVTAAILAGGRARRFGGRDKSALPVEGRSILDRQLAEVSAAADEILIVGRLAPPVAGVRMVADRVPGCGPLGGVHTALAESAYLVTLVVACDMPFITAPLLRHLASLAGADADLVVPRTEDGYHPLCAAYTRACLAPIARRLADRRLEVAGLFEDVRVRVVPPEELDRFGDRRRLLANVNTPADHRELELLRDHEL